MIVNDLRVLTKTIHHPRVMYVFREKLRYNQNSATLVGYNRNIFVWRNTRENYVKEKKTERRWDSISRARERLYDVIECNLGIYPNPPIFLTLTFAQNIDSLQKANPLFTAFIRKLNTYLRIKTRYVAVPEFQQRGAVHYHVLFFNLPFIHYDKIQTMWGHGFSRIEKTKHVKNISAYVAKYLSKETFDKRLYGQRAFFSSRGLLRSEVIRDRIEIEEVITNYKQTSLDKKNYCYVKNYTRIERCVC